MPERKAILATRRKETLWLFSCPRPMEKSCGNEVSSTQSTGDAVSMEASEEKAPSVGRVITGKLENYVILSHVQECLYGSVMAGVGLTTGDAVAIKSLRRRDTDNREMASLSDLPETPLADVFFAPILHGLKGVSVIREVIGLSDFHFVISDFANGEDLIELLKLYPYGLPETITSIAMRCAAEGLAACHSKGVALQDFSLENCLLSFNLDGTYEIRICDPGQATLFKRDETQQEIPTEYKGCVGKKFRPPEIFTQQPYLCTKVDAWCLGWSTFYFMFATEIFASVHPIDEDFQWELFSSGRMGELFQVCGIDQNAVSAKSIDFIVRLLDPNPETRMSVTEALEHPFLLQSRNRILTRDLLPPQHESREFRDPERFIIQCLSLAADCDKPRLMRIFALQLPLLRRAMNVDFSKPLAEIESRSRTVRRLLAETGPAIPRRYFTYHLLLFCQRNRPSYGLVSRYEASPQFANRVTNPLASPSESPRLFPLSTGRSSKLSPRTLLQSPLTRRLNGRDTQRSTDETTGSVPAAADHQQGSQRLFLFEDGVSLGKKRKSGAKKVALERPPESTISEAASSAAFMLARTVDTVTLGATSPDLSQRQASETCQSRRRLDESLDRPARLSKQPTPLLKPSKGSSRNNICCVQDSPKARHSRGCLSIYVSSGPDYIAPHTPPHSTQTFPHSTHTLQCNTQTLPHTPLPAVQALTLGQSLSSTSSYKRQRSSRKTDRATRDRDRNGKGRDNKGRLNSEVPLSEALLLSNDLQRGSASKNRDKAESPSKEKIKKESTALRIKEESGDREDATTTLGLGSEKETLARKRDSLITRPVTPLRIRADTHVKINSHASDDVEEDDIRVSTHTSSHLGHQQSLSFVHVPSSSPSPAASLTSPSPSGPYSSHSKHHAVLPSPLLPFKQHAEVSTVEGLNANAFPMSGLFPNNSRLTIGIGSTSRIISSRLTNEWPFSQNSPSDAANMSTLPNSSTQPHTSTHVQTTTHVPVSLRHLQHLSTRAVPQTATHSYTPTTRSHAPQAHSSNTQAHTSSRSHASKAHTHTTTKVTQGHSTHSPAARVPGATSTHSLSPSPSVNVTRSYVVSSQHTARDWQRRSVMCYPSLNGIQKESCWGRQRIGKKTDAT
eukprot:Gregarina_sp_Poly_1__1368@NODE_133_length_13228_cov_89_141783_g119_i0_p2_GENE_NODE_133_length_13228_cov_89_141783_g119_i0NODE_133_length_13228_cov_89_141783_g119_i0_p2_ORF_typecomplete_len1129_score168_26Pkinase/PF00069_25/7e27Pkinase_Tyr/PF07714_17/3_5e11TRF/PF08558_10/1_8e02TRF/PF08558_10/0_47_NODE_133_length_13228_cov_89_141783_g119_i016645050